MTYLRIFHRALMRAASVHGVGSRKDVDSLTCEESNWWMTASPNALSGTCRGTDVTWPDRPRPSNSHQPKSRNIVPMIPLNVLAAPSRSSLWTVGFHQNNRTMYILTRWFPEADGNNVVTPDNDFVAYNEKWGFKNGKFLVSETKIRIDVNL